MDLRRAKSRKKLREALGRLLQEKPLEEISIESIAAEAKVTRPTFYSNYPDRQAIVIEHVETWAQDLLQSADKLGDLEGTTTLEKLQLFIEQWLESFDPNDHIIRIALSGRAGTTAQRLIGSTGVEMVRLRAAQFVPSNVPIELLKATSIFYSTGINAVMQTAFAKPEEYDPKAIAKLAAKLIYSGVEDLLE